ncbi:MAG: Ldh family oxidoreductase, partial [Chloroflexi bacterium]|nr:Ldh family oxidoreductase [Chloroflexota bacterium]
LRTQRMLQDGIFIEDSTWERLKSLASEYGLEGKLGMD